MSSEYRRKTRYTTKFMAAGISEYSKRIMVMAEAGCRIPEDMAIVGFDDIPLCEYLSPPLTTIHVPRHIFGETAVRRLIEIVELKDSYITKIEIGTKLVKRKSVSFEKKCSAYQVCAQSTLYGRC